MSRLNMKISIPEFIPSSAQQEMVWSPTSGSRPRRPSDDDRTAGIQVSDFKARIASPTPSTLPHQSSTEKPSSSPEKTSPTKLANSPPVTPQRPLSLPPKPDTNPSIAYQQTLAYHAPMTDVTNQQTASPFPRSPRKFASRAHYHELHSPQRGYQAFTSMNDQEPAFEFPAPPRPIPAYNPPFGSFDAPLPSASTTGPAFMPQHRTSKSQGQPWGTYRESVSAKPENSHQHRLPLRSSGPTDPQSPQDPAFVNQLNSLTLGPTSPPAQPYHSSPHFNRFDPTTSPRPLPIQVPPYQAVPSYQHPDLPPIPNPGNMDPLAYWNLLHHLTARTLSSLSLRSEPPTPLHQAYLAQLQQARVAAAATQLPNRGPKGPKKWMNDLQKVLEGIWVLKEGEQGWNDVVRERKEDFEAAVRGEMDRAREELAARREKKRKE